MPKIDRLTPHSKVRFYERTSDISKRELEKAVKNRENIEFFKRETTSRSMAYVFLSNDRVVKVILQRSDRKIITILPWMDVYNIQFIVVHNNEYYLVNLFPDCFKETSVPTALTTIYKLLDNGEKLKLAHNDHDFENLFYMALKKHYTLGGQLNEQDKIKEAY
jgi:hypothetical protein